MGCIVWYQRLIKVLELYFFLFHISFYLNCVGLSPQLFCCLVLFGSFFFPGAASRRLVKCKVMIRTSGAVSLMLIATAPNPESRSVLSVPKFMAGNHGNHSISKSSWKIFETSLVSCPINNEEYQRFTICSIPTVCIKDQQLCETI